jgi:hypothetical protein
MNNEKTTKTGLEALAGRSGTSPAKASSPSSPNALPHHLVPLLNCPNLKDLDSRFIHNAYVPSFVSLPVA